jgi:NAD(P)H-nitrite reductase large subunit
MTNASAAGIAFRPARWTASQFQNMQWTLKRKNETWFREDGMKFVIIGAGAAGVHAAKAIREIDNRGEIVLLGEERFFPYNRYMLTDFLCDQVQEDELIFSSAEIFDEIGIKFRKGERVKSINPYSKVVKLHHNEVVPYDKLLIATGGNPGLGPVLKPFQTHIQRYYSLEDILVLKRKMASIKNCVVFGEGLSSLDLLRGLCSLGKQVTYIIRGKEADWSLVEPELYPKLIILLKDKGVKILSSDRIISIRKEGHKYRVHTLKQQKILTDMVFAWDVYSPNINCIRDTQIEKKMGILVDETLKTSVKDIFAAGDCVEIYHPGIKNYWINFGWPNAVEQGMIAGKNMAGQNLRYQIHETLVCNLMGKSFTARWWK